VNAILFTGVLSSMIDVGWLGKMNIQTMIKNRKAAALVISLIIIGTSLLLMFQIGRKDVGNRTISISEVLDLTSKRRDIDHDHVLLENGNRSMAFIGTYLSCWYDISDGSSHLLPLLIEDPDCTRRVKTNLGLNSPINLDCPRLSTNGYLQFSTRIASTCFERSKGMMVMGTDNDDYNLGLITAPLSSYLNIPVVIVDEMDDPSRIRDLIGSLKTDYIIPVGDLALKKCKSMGVNVIPVTDTDEAYNATSIVIEDRFGRLDYITLTNPSDTIPVAVTKELVSTQIQDFNSLAIETNTVDVDLLGESVSTHPVDIEEGIVNLRIEVGFTEVIAQPLDPLKEEINVEPMSFITLSDPQGRLVGSSPSFSVGSGNNYIETLVLDNPGEYELKVKVYFGIKGASTMAGSSFGISRLKGSYSIETHNTILSDTNLPYYANFSILSPYLSASRGGMVIADPDMSLYSGDYRDMASGYSTGPWYERDLMEYATSKAHSNAELLSASIDVLPDVLRTSYLEEHGWLALLGGGTMIPMAYEEKDPSWEEDEVWGAGWATDLPYSLDLALSVGRPLGRSVADCSVLIARTLFYEEYTEGHISEMESDYGNEGSWKDHFHFLAGEGGGRTGWLFHQREFSATAREHGFDTEIYMQDYENGREYLVARGVFERANYFEMVLHGDWSWFSPELNGWDQYSTGIRVSDILKEPGDWELGPSVFISGVCLLGRIGGLRPEQSITQTFIHAGVNAFFSATRSTGQDAKAGPIEEGLLFDDLSTGEALRKDKRENDELPTYFVRTLYGDPAFDPYEPENGYGDQGRPEKIRSLLDP
jgi:hypothetical protein